MKRLKRFFGVCIVLFALTVAAGPVQAGYPLAIWAVSADMGGYVVLMDFDASVFTLAEVAQLKALLTQGGGSTARSDRFLSMYSVLMTCQVTRRFGTAGWWQITSPRWVVRHMFISPSVKAQIRMGRTTTSWSY